MDLNQFIFPAPKCSYSTRSLIGRLIYIPKIDTSKPRGDQTRQQSIQIDLSKNTSEYQFQQQPIVIINSEEKQNQQIRQQNSVEFNQNELMVPRTQYQYQQQQQQQLSLGDFKLVTKDFQQIEETSRYFEENENMKKMENEQKMKNQDKLKNSFNDYNKARSYLLSKQQDDGDNIQKPDETDEPQPQQHKLLDSSLQSIDNSFFAKQLDENFMESDDTPESQQALSTPSNITLYSTLSQTNPVNQLSKLTFNKHLKKYIISHYDSYDKFQTDYHIPCLLLQPTRPSAHILVYFHGNGEDINHSRLMLEAINSKLNIYILAMEYPGYGFYDGVPTEDRIYSDSETVIDYLVNRIGFDLENILLMGRSIGSGPATYIAKKRAVGVLILISPFTSLRDVIKGFAGFAGNIFSYLVKERFRNIDLMEQIKVPTLLIHGKQDTLIPHSHSEELKKKCGGVCVLHSSETMTHSEFDMEYDFLTPFWNFLLRIQYSLNTDQDHPSIELPDKIFEPPLSFIEQNK